MAKSSCGCVAPKPAAAVRRSPAEQLIAGLGLLTLCALVGYATMAPIGNPDFGWHAALGRLIVETRSVPDTEPFTHTARGAPMVAHEWLSQVAYYGVIQLAGLLGLRWANAALAMLLLVLLFAMLRRAGAAPAFALLGVSLYAVIAQQRLQLRPHMLNLAFAMAVYGYLFQRRPRLEKRQLALVFLITLLWVNMHSGAVMLAALLFIHLAAEVVDRRLRRRAARTCDLGRGDLRRLVLLLAVVVLALLCTPSHIRLLPYLLETTRLNARLSLEWFPIIESWETATGPPLAMSCFWLVATAATGAAWLTRRRQPLSRLAVVLFATWLPIHSQRFVWVYFIPLLFTLEELGRWLRSRSVAPDTPRSRSIDVLSPAAAIAASLAISYPALVAPIPFAHFGQRFHAAQNFRAAMFPIGAVDFLDEVELKGPLFNSNKWGGYISMRTYDKYPVFIDGRWVTIGESVLLDSYRVSHRLPGSFDILDSYGIEILLVHRGWMTAELLRREKWIPIFENVNSGVYLRDRPQSAANLDRCAAYYHARGIPFDRKRGFDERAAFLANRAWADRMGVRRVHLEQFGAHGRQLGGGATKRVRGW